MPLRSALIGVMLALASLAVAQEPSEDPDNLGQFQELVDQASFPTVEMVGQARTPALAAFNSGDCEAALPLLQEWASKANWLANLIVQGIDPGYRNLRNITSLERLNVLTSYEGQANQYKRQRDHAMVMTAECLQALGRDAEAVATFARALELIPYTDTEYWMRAANGLYAYIGVEPLGF